MKILQGILDMPDTQTRETATLRLQDVGGENNPHHNRSYDASGKVRQNIGECLPAR